MNSEVRVCLTASIATLRFSSVFDSCICQITKKIPATVARFAKIEPIETIRSTFIQNVPSRAELLTVFFSSSIMAFYPVVTILHFIARQCRRHRYPHESRSIFQNPPPLKLNYRDERKAQFRERPHLWTAWLRF